MIESLSKQRRKLRSPLGVEHLLRVQALYRELVQERPEIFDGLPEKPSSWLRWRYLNKNTFRTFATAEYDPDTIGINPEAFNWENEILLKGLIHHELIHFVLGYSLGHNELFYLIQSDWHRYPEYEKERQKFSEHLHQTKKTYHYQCPNCDVQIIRARKMRKHSACSVCCEKFNNGEWSDSFTLITVGEAGRVHGDK
jgi:predicted SprT family Zn-dependent metalloprotease